MLTELCQELRNWFVHERHDGTYMIEGGEIAAPFLKEGQYFRVIGSVFNDGVHQYGTDVLIDETFTGSVWALAIPSDVIALADEISKWRGKYESTDSGALSPFTSESFAGYSYTKNGSAVIGASGWKGVFASSLNRWRKI